MLQQRKWNWSLTATLWVSCMNDLQISSKTHRPDLNLWLCESEDSVLWSQHCRCCQHATCYGFLCEPSHGPFFAAQGMPTPLLHLRCHLSWMFQPVAMLIRFWHWQWHLWACEALEWLKKETVIRIKHDYRSIGGPDAVTPELLNNCFERMSEWVFLAKETLVAEWPSFEAVRAFSVFQLRPKLSAATIKTDLSKICQIFGEMDKLPVLLRSFLDCERTASQRRSLDMLFSLLIIISFNVAVIVLAQGLSCQCHLGLVSWLQVCPLH